MAHHGTWKRLGDGSLLTQDAEEGLGHTLSPAVYLKILITLLVLTIITVWASQIDFGAWNTVIAMVIATVKAGLVASFFMHLKFEKKLILMYAAYPLILLFILIGGTVRDEETREKPSAITPLNAEVAPANPASAAHAEHGESH